MSSQIKVSSYFNLPIAPKSVGTIKLCCVYCMKLFPTFIFMYSGAQFLGVFVLKFPVLWTVMYCENCIAVSELRHENS